jgi:hypothetical protein
LCEVGADDSGDEAVEHGHQRTHHGRGMRVEPGADLVMVMAMSIGCVSGGGSGSGVGGGW